MIDEFKNRIIYLKRKSSKQIKREIPRKHSSSKMINDLLELKYNFCLTTKGSFVCGI